MSTIVNSAWKSQKAGAIVKFKGEEYEIGSNAFGSLEAAVAAGETSDLVIVDKKLTSPVKKENITGAATDIFTSTVKETESKDGKTYTKTVKFTAAAGGTASFKDEDAELVGFEKVTATSAGGTFKGGKQDISSSVKEVDDSDKGIKTYDATAAVSSTATGSLTVTGKAGTPSAAVSAITDSEGETDEVISIVKDAYKGATDDDLEETTAATYASVTLKNADLSTAVNGGVTTQKAVIKTSNTNDEKINEEYTYSATSKIGSGTATLTDANAGAISGFKTVKISASAAAKTVGSLNAENETADYSVKTAYVADQSFSYTGTAKETEANAGSLTIAGKTGKEVTVDGEIEGFTSMNLKFATVNKEIEADAESSTSTTSIAVKNQKDVASLTATYSEDSTRTADGSLTAANSVIGDLDGVKAVTISNSEFNGGVGFADATNTKTKTTKKETGVAVAGISDNASDYVDNFLVIPVVDAGLVDVDSAYTVDYARKVENSVGGTTFKISGKTSADSTVTVSGYKSVNLDNTDNTYTLTAALNNDSTVTDTQVKESFAPESSYSYSSKMTTTDKAFGDASIKGRTTVTADDFASVKVAGTIGKTVVGGIAGQNTYSNTVTTTETIKAGKENAVGSYTQTTATSNKAASTADISKATLSGTYSDLKTAKLQGVAGTGAFSGAVDSDEKTSVKKDWNADEISAAEAAKAPGLAITDAAITAWTQSSDSKESAAGTFSLKNSSETFAVSANKFKSVDVAGAIGKTTLTSVAGQDTETSKSSKSLTVNATKGTYSESETESTQAATTLTVNKASIGTTFNNLKTVKLTDAAADAPATFTATVDFDDKSSKKFDWNPEVASFEDIMTPGPEFGINNPSITSWTESSESKSSAAGTFTLKNSAAADGTFIANNFKSVDVTGVIDHTVVGGAAGQDTETSKSSKSLSVNKAKGTYSDSDADTSKAATTLTVSKANVKGAFSKLKSATLNDVKVAANTTFTASLDTDSKSSSKIEWNAEDAAFGELTGPYDENVTSWTETSENKSSVVGSFTLKKAAFADADFKLGIDNFKTVDISGVTNFKASSLANAGDHTDKSSLKRAVSETKRTQEVSNSSSDKAVGSLKLTGSKADPIVMTLDNDKTIGYSTITLKDAKIVSGGTTKADAYEVSSSYTAKESATLDSGSPVTTDLKVTKNYSKKGNGTFTASGSNDAVIEAFNGSLNGFTSISLTGKISIGDVDNYKYDGRFADTYAVPFNGEYFDVIAVNAGAEPAPGDEETLRGNVSGSYSMDKSGQITSKWTASYATIANGSFKQTATDKNVTAGDIIGYDKVELTGVKTAGDIDGTNRENATSLNYKYAKDEEVANIKIETASTTSASSVKVTGKSFGELQTATVDGDISGYKSVTLQDASVTGEISAEYNTLVTTTDAVNSPDVIVVADTSKSVGTLSATSSQLADAVSGFQKVELKNVKGSDDVDFAAGDSYVVDTFDTGMTPIETITDIQTATGSFSAVSSEKNKAPKDVKLNVLQEVGDIVGYQKVELKDYIAGAVSVGFAANNFGGKAFATSVEVIAEDEEKETPKTWKKAAATKGNTFTATADSYVEAGTAHRNELTVTSVTGYGKVEATGLSSIGAITNASIKDSVDPGVFDTRFYSATHYGDWTATAKVEEGKYTAISAAAGSNATIKGIAADTAAETAVTGNVLGYTNVKMDTVKLGAGAAVTYAGGKYTYATKTNSDDEVIATSTSTADGKIEIKNATFVASTTFGVEGFKTVAIDIDGKAAFTSIIGGTEVAQFTGDALDYTTYKFADKATVTTEDGSVAGKVAGFVEVFFTDTNFTDASEIFGYEIGTKKDRESGELVQTYSAKTAVTFDNTDDDAKTLEGKITNARSIVFKSSVADAGVDFAVTGEITSLASEVGGSTSGDLTIEIDKSQISLDLSKLALDKGDEINMISSTGAEKTATIALGDIADVATLEGMIADINDVAFTGAGDITFGTIDEQDFADTLAANKITWGENITFNGVHYNPTPA